MSKFGRIKNRQELFEPLTRNLEGITQQKLRYNIEKVNQRKALQHESDKDQIFIESMEGIIKALPIDNSEKNKLFQLVNEYKIDFIFYAQCQENQEEPENIWAASLLPIASNILDLID